MSSITSVSSKPGINIDVTNIYSVSCYKCKNFKSYLDIPWDHLFEIDIDIHGNLCVIDPVFCAMNAMNK